MRQFSEALVAAVSLRGSILAVADRLGVAPQTVYGWIAGVDWPDEKEQARLIALLESPG
jgi:hypothetical protein